MATPARPRDSHRGHLRTAALAAVRDRLVLRVTGEIGRPGLKAHDLRRFTRVDVNRQTLNRLLNGDCEDLSDNRLLLVAERLGVPVAVTVH